MLWRGRACPWSWPASLWAPASVRLGASLQLAVRVYGGPRGNLLPLARRLGAGRDLSHTLGMTGFRLRAPRFVSVVTLSGALWFGMLASNDDAAAGDRAQVTFSGFQRGTVGDGTLFVHMTQRAEFTVRSEGNHVIVKLSGAGIDVRNNRHPLDLSHFELLLVSSRLVEVGPDVELRLELRRPVALSPHWIERKDGLASLHVPIPAS